MPTRQAKGELAMEKPMRFRMIAAALNVVVLLAGMMMLGACGSEKTDPVRDYMNDVPARQLKTDQAKGIRKGDAVVALLSDGEQFYVPMREVAMIAGYELKRNGEDRSYQIGYHDPLVEIRVDAKEAVKDGKTVPIPDAPLELSGSLHLPLTSFKVLFADQMSFTAQGSRLLIHSNGKADSGDDIGRNAGSSAAVRQSAAEFRDEVPLAGSPNGSGGEGTGGMRAASLDSDGVIAEARKYLGVRYEFGTGPYSENNRSFDCSTFTRHVFSRFGIDLPRTAREQARLGQEVSRSALRKGDLLFFRVPGRFEKENTIGHVGIYMGNGKMIHASPQPKNGVQISDINTPYWKENFITAKRLR
jgi:cell wall-associated NlpC family hydrolase